MALAAMLAFNALVMGSARAATEWIIPTEQFPDSTTGFEDVVSSFDGSSETLSAMPFDLERGYASRAYVVDFKGQTSSKPSPGANVGPGLPDDGIFSGIFSEAPGLDVKLAKFNTPGVNNVWKVTTAGQAMTVPVTPRQYQELHVFASAGGVGVGSIPTFRLTANFTDGSRQSGLFKVMDWVRYSGDGNTPAAPTDTASGQRYFLRQGMWRVMVNDQSPGSGDENGDLDTFNGGTFNVMGFRLFLESSRTLESFKVEVVDVPPGVSYAFWGAMATQEDTSTSTFHWVDTNDPDDVGGEVTCTDNPVLDGFGTTCTANPNNGFSLGAGGWSNCTGSVSTTNVTNDTCTIAEVNDNTEAAIANFVQDAGTVLITASANTGGDIDPSGEAVVNSGGTASFTVSPSVGFSIDTVTGCGGDDSGITGSSSSESYTTATVTSDCTVTATFQSNFPSAQADSVTIDEDASATTINVLNNDDFGADGPSTTQAVVISGSPANGTVVVNNQGTASQGDDTVDYTPDADFSGTDTFEYEIADATGDVVRAEVTVTVDAVNDAPSFTKGSDQSVGEDAGAQTVNGWASSISAGPNEGGQTVSFNANNDNNGLFASQPAIDSSGNLSYTPAADANGSATVTVSLSDDGGTSNGGSDTSADQTFSITVSAVNDAPSFTKGADPSVNEDAGAQSVNGWATGITTGPSNESGQSITGFSVSNDNNALFASQPAIDTSGNLSYTPAGNAYGSATVTVSVSDDGGTSNGGSDTSGDQTFTITVNPVNDAPSFGAGADQSVDEDAGAQTVTGWATGISTGPSNESGQSITGFNVSNDDNALFASQPAIDTSGNLTYTPADDANGSATVTVSVSDDGGTLNGGMDTSGNQTFMITVDAVNDAPGFTKGPDQSVDEDAGAQTVTGWATGISTGPSNESGQSITGFNVSNDNNGLFASQPAVDTSGELTYTPADDANGSASVTVSVSDDGGTSNGGQANSASETFSITVNPVNDPPEGTPGILGTATEGETLSVDTGPIADADGLGSFSYQWLRDGTPIAGESASSLVLDAEDVGASIRVRVSYTDGDGTSESVDSAAVGPVAAGDNDENNNGIPDDLEDAPDSDGDGVPDEQEVLDGTDPDDPLDFKDSDGDGVPDFEEILEGTDPNADDIPPEVSAPPAVRVQATQLFTRVTREELESLGDASASDGLDGDICCSPAPRSTVDGELLFPPGRNQVTWVATDAAGNQGTSTQTLDVEPLVSLSVDQTLPEGAAGEIKVILNGPAPEYPVSIPYTVGGTAGPEDHDLVSGTVEIESGLQGIIGFKTLADAVDENDETLTVALGEGVNTGPNDTHVTRIREGNIPPRVDLVVEQGGQERITITPDGGPVRVSASAKDPNPGDQLTRLWDAGGLLEDGADETGESILIDPGVLAPGDTALVSVAVSDDGDPSLTDTAFVTLRVLESLPPLDPQTDSDGDGLPDAQEGWTDSDQDGIPDFRDSADNDRSVMPEQADEPQRFLMESTPGTSLRLGRFALVSASGGTQLMDNEIQAGVGGIGPDPEVNNVGGVVDFSIDELSDPGQSAQVVIPQRRAIPEAPIYRKFEPADGWSDFVEDGRNLLASAPGEPGFCPPAGSEAFTPGLTPGHWCVQLTLEDGGPNDADGQANGRVLDPGGVGTLAAGATEGKVLRSRGGGGSVGPWGLLGLLSLALLGLCNRRPRSFRRLWLLGALALVASNAAGDTGNRWYLGAELGQGMTDVDSADINRRLAANNISGEASLSDETRPGFRAYLGYQWRRWLSTEAGYTNLGEITTRLKDARVNTGPAELSDVRPGTGDGAEFSALARYEYHPDWFAIGRVGLLYWQSRHEIEAFQDTGDGVDPVFGVGVEHRFHDRWSARFSINRYRVERDETVWIGVGVNYHFDLGWGGGDHSAP